jgi:hypothetical protein
MGFFEACLNNTHCPWILMLATLCQGPPYGNIVTCHKALQSEELAYLSQVTSPFEALDNLFSVLLTPKFDPKW